jgi:hypothetical protein
MTLSPHAGWSDGQPSDEAGVSTSAVNVLSGAYEFESKAGIVS